MRIVLRFALIILLSSAGYMGNAQVVVTSNDTTVCAGTPIPLSAVSFGRTGTSVSLSDDLYTGILNLGFNFTFYGNTYNQCVFSSNGYISFDITQANLFSQWAIGNGIPGNTALKNSIAGFYADILPMTNQGTLDYATVGTAPNRRFVLSFCDVPMFFCTNQIVSFQIVLYETTNVIEVHLSQASTCTTWNQGYAIEGIQNDNLTIAHEVPGRNFPNVWAATKSSHRFTPNGTNNYNVVGIPYTYIPNAGVPIGWFANGVTPVGNGGTVTVTPTANTFYVARSVSCSDTTADTVYVNMGGLPTINFDSNGQTSSSEVDPSICGALDGSFRIYNLDPNDTFTLKYKKNGVQVQLPISSNNNGVIFVGGLGAGIYSDIVVSQGLCFSSGNGSLTLNDPPFNGDFTFNIDNGCDADTVSFTNTSVGVFFSNWDFGDGIGDTALNPTHVYQNQNNYNVTLFVSNGFCLDTVTKAVDVSHPLDAIFTVDDDSICQNGIVNFTNTSIGAGLSYYWDFGDGGIDASNTPTPIHTYTNTGVYSAMLVITDFVPCNDTYRMIIVVDTIAEVSFTTSDSVLCEGQGITLQSNYTPIGSTGITWELGDGTSISNRDTFMHAYDTAGVFTVTLTGTYRICPDASFTKDILIKAFPRIDLGPDTVLCPNGQPIALFDHIGTSGGTYLWSTGETTQGIVVSNIGIYSATVSDAGCTGTDSIEVLKDCYLDLPNAFSPNGDGNNDYFLPRQLLSRSVTRFSMTIYNRWGQTIFETTSLNGRGWDGKLNGEDQPGGVYIYMMEATFANGTSEKYQGNVTLLR